MNTLRLDMSRPTHRRTVAGWRETPHRGSAFVARLAGIAAWVSLAVVDYVDVQSGGGTMRSVPAVRRLTLTEGCSCKTATTHNVVGQRR